MFPKHGNGKRRKEGEVTLVKMNQLVIQSTECFQEAEGRKHSRGSVRGKKGTVTGQRGFSVKWLKPTLDAARQTRAVEMVAAQPGTGLAFALSSLP